MAITDWFKRRSDRGFVSEHGNRSLNWDFGMSDSYSSFFAPDLDKQQLIKDSYKHVCDIRDIMNVSKSVKISLYADNDSYSTSDEVVISTKVFDDNSLKTNQKLDIFLGLSIHEFAHILYTNLTIDSRDDSNFVKQLANVIEDERIESKTTESYPGYANFLKETKYYFFDKNYIEDHIDDLMDVLQTVLYLIRYPGKVNEDIYLRHQKLFEQIHEVMSTLGESYKTSQEKARMIWNLIREYFKIPHDPPASKNSSSPKNNSKNNCSNSSNGEGENTEGQSDSNESNNESNNEIENSESSDEDLKSSGKVQPGDAPSENGTINPRSAGDLDNAAKYIARKIAHVSNSYTRERSKEIKTKWDAQEYAGDLIRENKSLILKRQEDDSDTYQNIKQLVGPHINALVNTFNKFFIEQEYRLTGLRRGKLDTNKLAEAFQNVETVYNQTFKRTTSSLDLCLLIDESGSMYGPKIEKAQTAAILLNEVCLRLPKCNLFVYGHTADLIKSGDTVINVYRDRWNKNKYALGSVEALDNNRDHEAILETYKLVRKQTNNPLLMFVVSDGYPAANGLPCLDSSLKLVKDTVNSIEAKGDTIVCQIAIESHIDSSKMFNHYVTFTDLESFPKELSNYVLKVLISKLNREDK